MRSGRASGTLACQALCISLMACAGDPPTRKPASAAAQPTEKPEFEQKLAAKDIDASFGLRLNPSLEIRAWTDRILLETRTRIESDTPLIGGVLANVARNRAKRFDGTVVAHVHETLPSGLLLVDRVITQKGGHRIVTTYDPALPFAVDPLRPETTESAKDEPERLFGEEVRVTVTESDDDSLEKDTVLTGRVIVVRTKTTRGVIVEIDAPLAAPDIMRRIGIAPATRFAVRNGTQRFDSLKVSLNDPPAGDVDFLAR